MEKEIIEFRKEYKKAYKGILPDEVLDKGNPWFENFIIEKLEARGKKVIKEERINIAKRICKFGRNEVVDELLRELTEYENKVK